MADQLKTVFSNCLGNPYGLLDFFGIWGRGVRTVMFLGLMSGPIACEKDNRENQESDSTPESEEDSSSSQNEESSDDDDDDDDDDTTTVTGDDDDDDDDVPADIDYCKGVVEWENGWRSWEQEVLELVNEARGKGADCGDKGMFDATDPLSMQANLRCAARAHSKDMVDRDFFDHTNPDGEGPGERLKKAEYSGNGWGENIASGQSSPSRVVDGWLGSDGHCANIMRASYKSIGVGYFSDGSNSSHMWTQTFGG